MLDWISKFIGSLFLHAVYFISQSLTSRRCLFPKSWLDWAEAMGTQENKILRKAHPPSYKMWCIILRNFKQFLISREIDYLSKLFLVASKCQVVFWNSVDVASSEESCEYAWLQWTLGHRDSWVVECGEWMWCPPPVPRPAFLCSFVGESPRSELPSSPRCIQAVHLCVYLNPVAMPHNCTKLLPWRYFTPPTWTRLHNTDSCKVEHRLK